LINYKTFALIDTNDKQDIKLDPTISARTLKLTMRSFYDLYGRVIVYDLKLFC
jgi:hypothetical protein